MVQNSDVFFNVTCETYLALEEPQIIVVLPKLSLSHNTRMIRTTHLSEFLF